MILTVSKGQQITIPANIREQWGLHPGSKVELAQEKGKIILQPLSEDINTLFKKAKQIKPKRHLTPAQMDELNERAFR